MIRFSFDDCSVSDLRVASLLSKYGFTGTFYMSNSQVPGTIQLSLKEIKNGLVDTGHELGGHTVSHPMDMKLLDDKKLKFEIDNNKFLCHMLMKDKPVTKFCYPRGRHDERVRKAVKDAGYTEARTTEVLKILNATSDPYQTPTTIHMFQRDEYNFVPWLEVAKNYFKTYLEARKTSDEVFYSVWGHSQELDRYADWENFESLLKYIRELSPTRNVANATNSL